MNDKLESINLSWEHGQLQSASFAFAEQVSDNDARALLGLPPPNAPPADFHSIDLQACATGKSCLLVQKFEHMGSGEIDCDGEGGGN